MEVNGWRLFQCPLFESQLRKLTEAVEQLSTTLPDTYREHPKTKLLATIYRLITEIIPRDPSAPEFWQGDTLGPDNRHWFRAKFHQRYRLFFRFSTKDRVIVYVWVNDEFTLRKAGSKTDAYAVFKSMLSAGNPPRTLEALLKSEGNERSGLKEVKLSFTGRMERFYCSLRVCLLRNFALGRVQNSDEAIGIVNVDQKVPSEVLGELRAITAVRQARVIEIR